MKIKLFLVLLFCAVTVTAQERIDLLPNYNPYQKKGDIVVRDDSRIFEQWLVDEWQSYQKECYADSQYVGFGYWLSADGMKWWHEVSEDETRWSMTKPFKRYKHREPTFPGFMQYLENKLAGIK